MCFDHLGLRAVIDPGLAGSLGGYHDSRRCSRDTYPESYITKYTSIRRLCSGLGFEAEGLRFGFWGWGKCEGCGMRGGGISAQLLLLIEVRFRPGGYR